MSLRKYVSGPEVRTTTLPNGSTAYHCRQRSREWIALRVGMPTASRFASLITAKTLRPSMGRFSLIAQILAERRLDGLVDWQELDDPVISGVDSGGTPWQKRGSELEDDARRWYQLHKGVKVTEIGFVSDGRIGCSPDGMVEGSEIGLEIKCRNAAQHLRRVLGYESIADRTQIQGTLFVTGWKAVDAVAFNPDLPKRIVRHHPDPAFFKAFRQALAVFEKDLEKAQVAMDGITEDCVEDDNLKALLAASLQKETTEADGALDLDTLDALREDMERAHSLGLWSDDDTLAVITDVEAGEWESVRGMAEYLRRLLETEATPA